MKLHLDFETRSPVNILTSGAWAYAMHPSTEVTCMAYGSTPDNVVIARREWVENRDTAIYGVAARPDLRVVAHSVHFEYAIYNYILHKRFGWPERWDPKLWDCTLARAAYCNLPLSLENCANALNLDIKKDMEGKKAMLALCSPIAVDPLTDTPIYREDPDLYSKMYSYCADDVRAEMGIDARLPELPEMERRVFELDLIMNHRGVLMDVPLARKASGMVAQLTEDLNSRLMGLTGGFLDKATQVARLREWLASRGVVTENLDKATVDRLLKDPAVPADAKVVINIRRQVGKTSTSKYNAILDVASPVDGRARGLIQYHGASTGRFAGRLIQPHNFPKGVTEEEQADIIQGIMSGHLAEDYGDEAMDALSSGLRGTIIAPEGKLLVAADYNAIEPRVLFWLAGDESALAAYRSGGSPYLDMGAFIFKKPITKKDAHEYAVAKFTILGAGYGMGPDRFVAQCAANGLTITPEMAATAVKSYREKYKSVVQMWYAFEGAAKKAIREPGSRTECCDGRIVWGLDTKREFLVCRLPSGRHLRYFRPRIHAYIHPEYGEREEIRYWSAGLGGALAEQKTYGGSLVENVVQAVARDLMVAGMLAAETPKYAIVLTCHDEILAETAHGNLEDFIALMCTLPPWAERCPVAAEGFVARRYRK